MERKKAIRRYSLSILFTTAFLILSTCFIFLPKHNNMVGALSFLGKMNNLSFIEISKDLALAYDFPISDSMGEYITPYEFSIVNHGTSPISYQLSLFTGNDSKRIPQNSLHYMIEKNGEGYSKIYTLSEDGEIALDEIEGNSTNRYAIKFWVHTDVDSSILGKSFQGIINLTAVH